MLLFEGEEGGDTMKSKKQFVTILSIASIFFILGTMANVKVTAETGVPFEKIQNYLTEIIKPKLDIINSQTGTLNWTEVDALKNQVADIEGLLTDSEYGLALLTRIDAEIKEVWDELLTIDGKLDTLLAEIGTSTSGPSTVMSKLEDIASKQPTITKGSDKAIITGIGEFNHLLEVNISKLAKVTITISLGGVEDFDEYVYFAYQVGYFPGGQNTTGYEEVTTHNWSLDSYKPGGDKTFEVVTNRFWMRVVSTFGHIYITYNYIIES